MSPDPTDGFETIVVDRPVPGVARITLDRTDKRNAINTPMRALSATYTRSHACASSVAPAIAYPCTCAITGLARSQKRNHVSVACRAHAPSPRAVWNGTWSISAPPRS